MPLPHIHNISTLSDQVFRNFFEIVLITPSLIIQEQIYDQDINFFSEKNKDGTFSSIIDITFTFSEKIFKDWNTKDYLNDIFNILLTTYDKKGDLLIRELIEVEFISSNVNFNYSCDDILSIQIKLKNVGIEQNISESPADIQKRMIRESKIKKLISSP